MSTHFHLDYETYSKCSIKKFGGYRYANDPSTVILLAAIARGDEKPLVWDYSEPDSEESRIALILLKEAAESGEIIYAHNAPFEMAVSSYKWWGTFGFRPPSLMQWRCSQALARRAALPQSLDELGSVLNISKQKDKRGKQLIDIFCIPRTRGKLKGTRIQPTDEGEVTVGGVKMEIAEAWELFREYCRRDVVAEREIGKLLASFELKGEVLASFQFDLRMNLRGLPVNIPALYRAQKIVEAATADEVRRCYKLCGLSPTQVQAVLKWLRERGYPGEDLREETMSNALVAPGEMTPEAIEVLNIRSRIAFSAVKKIPTMIGAACDDGRVRGVLQWSGATRTHRWSSKIIQAQNFKRPTVKDTHSAYQNICDGFDQEFLGLLYGNPVEVVASCIRHFIHDQDCDFLVADYSNIEARIVPWLAGQQSLLDAFRRGDDPYVLMAAKVFDKPADEVTKDERFVGKQLVLGAGYAMGWEKFSETCKKQGRVLDDDLCKTAIKVYREENSEIAGMWRALQRAAVDTIENPGKRFTVRGKITFYMARNLPFPALIIRLPSGHNLVYPWPGLSTVFIFDRGKYPTLQQAQSAKRRWQAQREKDRKAGKLTPEELEEEEPRVWETKSIHFMGVDPLTKKWGKRLTYGGSIMENCFAGETEVLTPQGWKRIDSLSGEKVFDGVDFVSYQSAKVTENVTTIKLDTLWVTPKHLILTKDGWVRAEAANIQSAYEMYVQRPHRTEIRAVDSAAESPKHRKECHMGMPMRVWKQSHGGDRRFEKGQGVWLQVPAEDQHLSQHVRAPHLPCVESNGGPLQKPQMQIMGLLWGKGDSCMRAVDGPCKILGGHGADLGKGHDIGKEKQLQGLQPQKLRLGYTLPTSCEPLKRHLCENPFGNLLRNRSGQALRHSQIDIFQPFEERVDRREAFKTRREPVYDLINCGPRHRYVVRGKNKKPIIVHNCSQAIAGDFISHGVLRAEEKGYEVVSLIHDEALASYRPEEGQTAEEFRDLLCTLPPWAQDFPLKADAGIIPFYSKD